MQQVQQSVQMQMQAVEMQMQVMQQGVVQGGMGLQQQQAWRAAHINAIQAGAQGRLQQLQA